MTAPMAVTVRPTVEADFPAIIELCRRAYPGTQPWSADQLASHLATFPEGQLVATLPEDGRVVAMSASLVVWWDDYDLSAPWREFTAGGFFTNHDPARGRTLYGAEIMVDPQLRRRGVGQAIYGARRELTRRLGLLRIRAGARLPGYGEHAGRLSPEQYAIEVVQGRLHDSTLTFQMKQGFAVLAVVSQYLRHDAESRGHAAVIEWLNPEVATPEDSMGRDPRFRGSL